MFEDIKFVVFDLDGTIVKLDVNWEQLREELRQYFRSHYNFDSDFNPVDEGIDRLLHELGDSAIKSAYEIIEKYEVQNIKNVTPIDGSLELIRYLKESGKTLAVFSNNTRKVIELALGYLGVREHFDMIVGKEDVRKHKPNPEGLILIKNKARMKKKDMCFVGDKNTDFECAGKFNILGIPIEVALNNLNINRAKDPKLRCCEGE